MESEWAFPRAVLHDVLLELRDWVDTHDERISFPVECRVAAADDLIDVASDADEMGKEPGTDLREGVDTLVVLRAKAIADPSVPADARLLELLGRDLSDDDGGVAEALSLLRSHRALTLATEQTEGVAREAQALLDPLPDSDAKAALRSLALSVVQRTG